MDFSEKMFTFWNKKYLQKPYCLTKEKVNLQDINGCYYIAKSSSTTRTIS